MCQRRTIASLLHALAMVVEDDGPDEPAEDRAKIERTLLSTTEYGPGQRPVLPEHRPLGGLEPQQTLLGGF